MKFYKKSVTVGWHVIILVLILIAAAIAFGYVIWQSGGPMAAYLDRIFG